jgi:hypothetical protein
MPAPRMLAPQPLYQIIYHSLATGEGMAPEVLADLLRQARSHNQDHRLTGLLLYAADTQEFVQVIEGPRDEIATLYARIARDPRHKHAFVLHEGPAAGRMFPDWRMGFMPAATQDLRTTTGYLPLAQQPGRLNAFSLVVHVPEELRRFLSSFTKPLPVAVAHS